MFLPSGPSRYEIVNNTIYEPTADAIYATGDDVHLRNNIIWTQAGYGVRIADDKQGGFTSDYNLLYATGTGHVGYWQGDRDTLFAWQNANFRDANSLSADPLFVDADGTDGVLAQLAQGLTAQYFGNRTLTGSPAFTRTERTVNTTYFGSPGGGLGRTTGRPVTAASCGSTSRGIHVPPELGRPAAALRQRPVDHRRLEHPCRTPNSRRRSTSARSAPVSIVYEMADDGDISNSRITWTTPTATRQAIPPGNLSTGSGGQQLARTTTSTSSPTTGSYKPATGTFTPDANYSPAIDRGRPGDPFGNESDPKSGVRQPSVTATRPRRRQRRRNTSSSPTPTAANASRRRRRTTSAGLRRVHGQC